MYNFEIYTVNRERMKINVTDKEFDRKSEIRDSILDKSRIKKEAENLISSGGHDFCHSAYVSSDNLIVLVADAGGNGNQYVGARLDYIDIQGDYARHINWPPRVTAVSYSNNTTGVY